MTPSETKLSCRKHPSYAGRGEPMSLCETCWDVYVANHWRLQWYIRVKGVELYDFAKAEGARQERDKILGGQHE